MESEKERPRRRKYDRMADKTIAWISTMWPILVCIIGLAFHSGIAKANFQSELKNLSEKNYRLYIQFDEFKKSNKVEDSDTAKAISELTTAVTKLTGGVENIEKGFSEYKKYQAEKISSLDDRYPLRKELDTRHFKTAYRNEQ
jgi:hypothetical protein